MFAAWKISKYPKEAATSVRRLLRIYLSDDLGAAREYARNSIATVGKPALNQVLARLNGEEPQAVVAVLNLLTSMHVDDAEGAKAIVAKLSDPNEAVAKAAAQALFCSTKTEFCVPLFSELLESGKANHAVRSTVVWSLATLGKDGAAATPGLIRAMSDKDPEIRRMSLGALEKIGCRNAPFVQALARAIFDDDKILRDDAFKDLAALGAPERSGEEVLIEALRNTEIKDEKERNQFVRDVIRAFDRFRGNKSAVVVATFLANTKLEVGTRQVAAEMVGKPGIRTKDILPQLRKSLEGVRGELERDPENNALRQLERTIQQAIADID